VAAAVVVAGGAVAAGVALLPRGDDVPTVGEITAEVADGRVLFRWDDPGLAEGDSFRVQTSTGESSVQRSTEFAAFPADATSVCITVTVVHAGRSGDAGTEKCASLP
jgi:hypothetical protein